jgi:crotonobetainyl-CoA:carnitine CoA-transferase CaiB-like acyl-CoA transferase
MPHRELHARAAGPPAYVFHADDRREVGTEPCETASPALVRPGFAGQTQPPETDSAHDPIAAAARGICHEAGEANGPQSPAI